MTSKALILVVGSVLLSALAQILLKIGMAGASTKTAMDTGSVVGSYVTILSQPFVLGGLACYVLGALVWLRVLSGMDVSKAYPFVALGIIATMALGAMVLGESVSTTRIVGGAVIAVGVVIVGMS